MYILPQQFTSGVETTCQSHTLGLLHSRTTFLTPRAFGNGALLRLASERQPSLLAALSCGWSDKARGYRLSASHNNTQRRNNLTRWGILAIWYEISHKDCPTTTWKSQAIWCSHDVEAVEITLQPWRWRQCVPTKPAGPYGETTQKD